MKFLALLAFCSPVIVLLLGVLWLLGVATTVKIVIILSGFFVSLWVSACGALYLHG